MDDVNGGSVIDEERGVNGMRADGVRGGLVRIEITGVSGNKPGSTGLAEARR